VLGEEFDGVLGCDKHGDAYFRFVTTPGVAPTNNLAEQAIRFVVLDRRVTQGTRSAVERTHLDGHRHLHSAMPIRVRLPPRRDHRPLQRPADTSPDSLNTVNGYLISQLQTAMKTTSQA